MQAKHELGQNFLFDSEVLRTIASYGQLKPTDVVLEIGPGLGSLTDLLCQSAGQVVAVEFDADLADHLLNNLRHRRRQNGVDPVEPGNLTVVKQDFLKFDLTTLPTDYKVIANIPYNITSKIIEKLWTSSNPPQLAVLLVQKEVAERVTAQPGQLSVLAIATQVFADVASGLVVPAKLFEPAPKVDSQVLIMTRRAQPLVQPSDLDQFFYVVRAGFSQRRKKLRSSLAVGLRTTKTEAERLLREAGIDPNRRAQELTIDDWKQLARVN